MTIEVMAFLTACIYWAFIRAFIRVVIRSPQTERAGSYSTPGSCAVYGISLGYPFIQISIFPSTLCFLFLHYNLAIINQCIDQLIKILF